MKTAISSSKATMPCPLCFLSLLFLIYVDSELRVVLVALLRVITSVHCRAGCGIILAGQVVSSEGPNL